jgi:protein required for attachment to host cells
MEAEKMAVYWILAADSAYAKILRTDKKKGALELIRELEHPESRMKDSDLYDDSPGRAFVSHGQGRHAMENEVDAKKMESIRFAQELADELKKAAAEDQFHKLYILAAPAFLGELREKLDSSVTSRIVQEIPKDVVKETPEKIRAKLPEYL